MAQHERDNARYAPALVRHPTLMRHESNRHAASVGVGWPLRSDRVLPGTPVESETEDRQEREGSIGVLPPLRALEALLLKPNRAKPNRVVGDCAATYANPTWKN